ncbi:MAG: sensor histidine kinase, partial [Parasporobacterium sp.]|nr:sensor histidine kinase [Parasporobacterium sp.]
MQEGKISRVTAKKQTSEYLQAVYQQSDMVSAAILFFPGEGEETSSGVYNERAEGSYALLRGFWEKDREKIQELCESLGTSVLFRESEGTLYLVRNLVDSHYVRQAVLVLCINTSYCFESLIRFPAQERTCVWLQDAVFASEEGLKFASVTEEAAGNYGKMYDDCREKGFLWNKGRLLVSEKVSGDSYKLRMVVMLEKEIIMYPFYGYPYIMGGILAGTLVLLAVMLKVFNREIAAPLSALSRAAGQIEAGQLGVNVEQKAKNLEFQYITDSFNRMSDNLKQQFDHIYEEEIALREARIKSLQSNINPHFLNNTLEIINWEARLDGNEKVSHMIEALSTVLDASLDRRKRPMVSLREEMGYVSAYLYIMGERFGDKLKVEIRVGGDLMEEQIPRLILQPVIENAIEHGAARKGSGKIVLSGYKRGGFLYLEVANDGKLEEEDQEKIDRLLAADYDPAAESSGHIGIANVNQRLKILFGEESGLSITSHNDETVALVKIPGTAGHGG